MDNFQFNFNLILSILFIISGSSLLITAFRDIIKNSNLKKNGIATTGKIIDIIEEDNEGTMYFPIVEFKTMNGVFIKKKLDGRSICNLEKGQEVELFYDIDAPDELFVNTRFETKYKYYLLIIVGLGILGGGIYNFIKFIINN